MTIFFLFGVFLLFSDTSTMNGKQKSDLNQKGQQVCSLDNILLDPISWAQ